MESKRKGPEVGVCLVCLRNIKATRVARLRGKWIGDEVRGSQERDRQDFTGHGKYTRLRS